MTFPIDHKLVSGSLVERGWLYRAFQVATPEGTYRITYDGRGLGHESVIVNGTIAAGKVSMLWFVPEVSFPVGTRQGIVRVRVWPWFQIRSLQLVVGGELVYSE